MSTNIQLNYYDGSEYQILYPQTLGSLVSGAVAVSESCTGNSTTATKLVTARTLKVNLASTSNVTFDGSSNQTGIGVSGTLAVARGGTGTTSLSSLASSLQPYMSGGTELKKFDGSYTGTGSNAIITINGNYAYNTILFMICRSRGGDGIGISAFGYNIISVYGGSTTLNNYFTYLVYEVNFGPYTQNQYRIIHNSKTYAYTNSGTEFAWISLCSTTALDS